MSLHRKVLRLVTVAVVVIVLAEVGVRLLAPYLPEPKLYGDDSTAVKAAQLERVGDTDRCATVVVAGNSMARDDFVPSSMAPGLDDGVVVYNAALDAASPDLLARWLPDHVLPSTDPDLVVIGLSSFDLNDEARISRSALDSFSAAPLSRDDPFGDLQQPLVRHVALFRHRRELRDPVTVWSSLDRARRGVRESRPDPAGIAGVLDADGAGLSRRDLQYTASPGSDTLLRRELLNDFAIGGRQTSSLRRLLTDLGDSGVDVVLAVLPVTDDYIVAHPDGAADHDRFLGLVDEIAAEADVTRLDLHDWAEVDDFADTHHLAGAAADRLSADLPSLLTEAGVALPGC
jgi:hypothetical protein